MNPLVLPQRSEIAEICEAVPEALFLQPHDLYQEVVLTLRSSVSKKFAEGLALAVGTVAMSEVELGARLAK